jgi:hypothetical protein
MRNVFRRVWLLAIVMGIVSAGVAACGGGSSASAPVGSSTAPTAPTATPAGTSSPVESTTSSPSEAFVPQLPVQACCAELALEPGPYALPGWLGPLLRVDVNGEWSVINDASARYLAFGRGENSVGTMASLITLLGTPTGTAVDDVIASLRSDPGLAVVGEPTPVTAGDFSGTELRASAVPKPDRTDDPDADIAAGTIDLDVLEPFVEPGFRLTTSTAEASLRFLVIDVDERVVIAWVEAPPDEADAFFADADELLGTLVAQ